MRITRVEAQHVRLSQVREIADGTQDCLVVRLHTDDGRTGLGEVTSCSYVARAVIEAAVIEGMDPIRTDRVYHTMRFKDGRLHLGDAPGLGVELNEDVLARFAVTE